ncbi:MAG: hypothetical protein JW891_02980 [Candidatus Lokiarchaeota archaeon]|nr:hypothetical protein [Candidatus Lokiarchaeota archaeon]
MLITTEGIKLLDYLREIEDITDLNGCFFVNVEDNTVIESTIPFFIPEEILWELSVLRDTFQQFASGFGHGPLQELTIEGDRGYIMFYNIPPHLILLAMGAQEINLSYAKLAMIDILKKIRKQIFNLGDDVLKLPAKGFGKIGIEIEQETKETAVSRIIIPEPVEEPTAPEMLMSETGEELIDLPVTPEVLVECEENLPSIPLEQSKPPITSEAHESRESGLLDLINSIKAKSNDEKYIVIKNIFSILKTDLPNFTGVKFSEILETLKDTILEHLGTSLALFDISRCSRDLSKNHEKFSPNEIKRFSERIDNWASRIIKI